MFRKQLISMIALWFILVFACLWILRMTSSEAEKEYQNLMSLSDQAEEEEAKEEGRSTHQSRYQVGKQILYKKGSERMESRLASIQSELMFDPHGGKGDLIEKFKGFECTMQEKKICGLKNQADSQQYIRFFKARQAVFSYKSGLLEAEKVEISHYLVPGHQWPEEFLSLPPHMKGDARKVQLSVFKEPSLKAEDFQASLFEWGDDPS